VALLKTGFQDYHILRERLIHAHLDDVAALDVLPLGAGELVDVFAEGFPLLGLFFDLLVVLVGLLNLFGRH